MKTVLGCIRKADTDFEFSQKAKKAVSVFPFHSQNCDLCYIISFLFRFTLNKYYFFFHDLWLLLRRDRDTPLRYRQKAT